MRNSVDVHNHLVERDIHHELINVRGRLRSAERIASVLDLPPGQVGKVVIYETDLGPLAALVASNREPDPELVQRAAKAEHLEAAGPSRASQLSEYLHEAIPPVGLPSAFTVLIDRPLARRHVLYFAGGEATAILKVRGRDLARKAGLRVARITAPHPEDGPAHP